MGFPGRGMGGELIGVSSLEVHPCLLFVSPVPVRSGFEEGGAGPRKEHARSDSENWRSLREEQEDDGSWRLGAGPRRDGDRWRSTSPGKMGARWGQDILAILGKRCHAREEQEDPRGSLVDWRRWGLAWLGTRGFLPFSNFLFQMVVPALLAGGSMGSGGASLILICEGSAEGVVKRMGGLGAATLTSGDAGGSMALKMTRMGSPSGAWRMRMRRWALSMPPEPSCPLRYSSQGPVGWWQLPPGCPPTVSTLPSPHRRAPRKPSLRSRSLI